VLGAIMLEKNAILEVIDILKPASFYNDTHQKIYEAVVHLSTQHKPIDILTVTDELRKRSWLEEVGGPYFITQLTSGISSSAHLQYHARIIAQKYIQRQLISISTDIQNRAFDPSIDVDDLLDYSEKQLFDIAYGNIKKEVLPIDEVVKKAINQITEASKRQDGLSGVPCGFTKLDRVTSGWQNSDLIIIAARPSMGKTASVLSMARNIAVEHKKPVAFFSLEMSSLQLVNRLIVSETGLSSHKIRTGRLENFEWEQLDYKIKPLVEAPIFIDDTPALSVFELRAKCRRLKMQHKIELVVIDHLQLMTLGGDMKNINREQEVSTISRGLKAIAKELDVPVIALSQLNRSVEMRSGDKRPQLSDLRESGAIEQDADLVIFIHRPEKYGLTEDADGNSTKGLAEIIIAKHRNGPVTEVQLRFMDNLAKFTDLEGTELITLADDIDTGNGFTIGSKMNEERSSSDDIFSDSALLDQSDAPF